MFRTVSSSWFETCTFWLWKINFKIWPQVRSRSGHDPSRSISTSSEASWRDKSFGTIRAFLSPFCRELLAKKRLRDEENFELGEPAPSFLKINSVDCDYPLMIIPKKAHPCSLAQWEKSEYDRPYCTQTVRCVETVNQTYADCHAW